MLNNLLALLRAIGSPLLLNQPQASRRLENNPKLYTLAEANKIPLMYLNTIKPDERRNLPEYNYHCTRLHRLLEITSEISKFFDEEDIDYVIFKTLRPYHEDVADIDVLNLGSHIDYQEMVEVLRRAGFVLMERGAYCTTFQDYKTRFKTELMIDVYNEISVGYLVYLDKRKLGRYISERELSTGRVVRVFRPEVELLVTIAHSAMKENQYTLAEYYVTLHYLNLMDQFSIEEFVSLVRENKLVNALRWHLTITSTLHKFAFDFIPEKLSNLLFRLGGPWNRAYQQVFEKAYPPYRCDPLTLALIFKEKMQDSIFKRSLCDQILSFPEKRFTRRLLTRLRSLQIL